MKRRRETQAEVPPEKTWDTTATPNTSHMGPAMAAWANATNVNYVSGSETSHRVAQTAPAESAKSVQINSNPANKIMYLSKEMEAHVARNR
jgi:hypothetical protein